MDGGIPPPPASVRPQAVSAASKTTGRRSRRCLPDSCGARARVRNRRADDARADFELPQLLAGPRIDGFEPAVQRAVEDDVARSDHAPAPHGELLFDLPDGAATRRIPRDERAPVATRTDDVWRRRADVRRPRNARYGRRLEVHTEIVRRGVEQAGAR